MRPLVIGIAGGSASGKSTLAETLRTALQPRFTLLLAMDDYYKPYEELPHAVGRDGRQYRDYNHPNSFDLPRLRSDLRSALLAERCDIVIIEGILALYDKELREQTDIAVYLDCPADLRILRRMRRNLAWGLSFDEIADVYVSLVRDRHMQYVAPSSEYAAFRFDTSDGTENALSAILAAVNQPLLDNSAKKG